MQRNSSVVPFAFRNRKASAMSIWRPSRWQTVAFGIGVTKIKSAATTGWAAHTASCTYSGGKRRPVKQFGTLDSLHALHENEEQWPIGLILRKGRRPKPLASIAHERVVSEHITG